MKKLTAKSIELPQNVISITKKEELSEFISNTKHDNGVNNGIIQSPFFNVTFNDDKVFSYSVPLYCTQSLFSFGYIEVQKKDFPVKITITAKNGLPPLSFAKIIPLKSGITPSVKNGKVDFTVNSFGYYTVLFSEDTDKEFVNTYTLIVKERKTIKIPKGYDLIEYNAGIHYVDRITNDKNGIKSNTVIYLHSGAYVVCKQPDNKEKSFIDGVNCKTWAPFINVSNAKNVIIAGSGVIDASNLSLHARTPIMINSSCKVIIDGITIINSPSWTIYVLNSKNIKIQNVIMLGYRINSDGIVPCNCKNVFVKNCFAKSGDDLFQAKAQSPAAPLTHTGGKNVYYKNCQGWAEKTRCFGFIQETEMDVNGVFFKDCSVIYHDAVWERAMGAFVVCVGDRSTVKNVKFTNCDAYRTEGYVINVYLGDNQWTTNKKQGCLGKIHGVKFKNIYFNSKNLKLKHSEQDSVVAVLLKNKKTVAKSNPKDFKNIVIKNLFMDGKKVDKNRFDRLTEYEGKIDKNNKKQIKIK